MATSSNRDGVNAGLDALLAELESPDDEVRARALKSLARLGPEAEPAIPRLEAMLAELSGPCESASRVSRLSWEAVDTLAAIGEKALPVLESLALRSDLNTAERAVLATGALPPKVLESAVPWLVKVVNHRRGDAGLYDGANVRESAAKVLGRVAHAAAAPLVELVQRDEGKVCIEVALALGAIGEAGAPAVPWLVKLLQRTEEHDSWKLLRVFGQIGPRAREAVPLLVEHLDARWPDVHRQMAAEALGRIGHEAAEAVPVLAAILTGQQAGPSVAGEAATALGRMGQGAREAVPALEACLAHADPYVRSRAKAALEQMLGPGER
ncbi:MAG: HEAT repeat domain-containing protein [Myxococcales bacterium]|jgi:HEAT repeat protein